MKNILTIIYTLCIGILIGCKSPKEAIEIIQLDTNHPIVLWFSPKYKVIRFVEFPIKLRVNNNSLTSRTYSSVRYDYEPFEKGNSISLYEEHDNKLKKISNYNKKKIAMYSEKNYVAYTRHKLDTGFAIQKHFKPYVEKMLTLNQDTLAIGTVAHFKTEHKEVLHQLLYQDSIGISFVVRYGKPKKIKVVASVYDEPKEIETRNIYSEPVKIPVKF